MIGSFASAAEKAGLSDTKAKESYSLGYEFGSNVKRQGVDIDTEVLIAAIRAGLEGKEPALPPKEMADHMRILKKTAQRLAVKRLEELSRVNIEKGTAFLAENKKKEGVRALPSGLQYKVLKEGAGPMPTVADSVVVNYKGTLIDGMEFDNSEKRGGPVTLPVKGTTKGWEEAIQLMRAGSLWEIYIPQELGYGSRPFGRIPPGSVLIFNVDLLAVKKPGESGPVGATSGYVPPAEKESEMEHFPR